MQRFDAIEGYRAVLAWWVVLAHTMGFAGLKLNDLKAMADERGFNPTSFTDFFGDLFIQLAPYMRIGKIPVYVFVLMSGFVISHLILTRKEPYKIYIMRRFMRLWPALMAVLLMAVLFRTIGMPFNGGHMQPIFWQHFLAEASMLQGLIPNEIVKNGASAVTEVGWSISLEWQFYIIAPFFFAAFAKQGWRMWIILVAVLIASFTGILASREMNIGDIRFTWTHPGALPHLIGFFFLGMVSYFGVKSVSIKPNVMAITIFVSGLILYRFIGPQGGFLPIMIWAFIIATIVTQGSVVHRVMESQLMRWLGTISYSTYIAHIFVISIVARMLKNYDIGDVGTFERLGYLILVAWPFILIVSYISYRFVEKPGIKFGKYLAARWSPSKKKITPDTPQTTNTG